MPKDPEDFVPEVPGRRIRHAIETLDGSLIRKVAETNIGRDDVIPSTTLPDRVGEPGGRRHVVGSRDTCDVIHVGSSSGTTLLARG